MGVITDFLDRSPFRHRLGMYVGADTGTALYYFLAGLCEGALHAGKIDHQYEGFKKWLQVRLGDKNWLRVALVERGMTEAEAREFFFLLWEEYRRSSG